MKKKVVVLGAGISGLTAAYALNKKGFDVTVVERQDCVGGLAATFTHKGYSLDYGPHNFHTHSAEVMNFVRDELGIKLEKIPLKTSKLFFMGKFVDYPIKISSAVRNLNLWVAFRCVVDYLFSRIKLKFTRRSPDGSFQDWVKSHFGTYLYELYFGPYVKKVWGIPASEIDVVVARKRIPEPSLFSLIIRSLTGVSLSRRKHSEDVASIESFYPPQGIGIISQTIASRLKEIGARVETESVIASLSVSSKSGGVISYSRAGERKELAWDYLVNTIPLNTFAGLLDIPGIDGVKKDAAALSYRSIMLLYMFLNVEKVFDDPWIYFNDRDNPELIFNRLYEIGNFSRSMAPANKGALCLEITSYKGDDIWNKKDSELFEICVSYLQKNKLMDRRNVEDILVKRFEVAYPVFRKGYALPLGRLMEYFCGRGDIFCIGRQGMFSYANMDHCIDMGLKLAGLFSVNGPDPAKFKGIFREYQ